MHTNIMEWKKLRKNVFFKSLARDKSRNFQIDIIKLEPNTQYKKHVHPDIEWIYVLKGSFSDEKGNYKQGDFIMNEKNSKHTVTSGPGGCKMLCCWCGKLNPT